MLNVKRRLGAFENCFNGYLNLALSSATCAAILFDVGQAVLMASRLSRNKVLFKEKFRSAAQELANESQTMFKAYFSEQQSALVGCNR